MALALVLRSPPVWGERWQALTPEQQRRFAPLCPELVVELVSPADEGPRGLAALLRKSEFFCGEAMC